MKRTHKIIAAINITLLIVAVVAVYGQFYIRIPTTGIVSVKNLIVSPDTINWGFVAMGSPSAKSVSLLNVGNMPFTNMNMTIVDAQNITRFNVDWNLEGTTIEAGKTVTATFTLTVYEWSYPSFSFDIALDTG